MLIAISFNEFCRLSFVLNKWGNHLSRSSGLIWSKMNSIHYQPMVIAISYNELLTF